MLHTVPPPKPPAIVESLPPSPSPLNAATSAAKLGSPMSIGYPIQPAADRLQQKDEVGLLKLREHKKKSGVTLLLAQERGGEIREFQIPPTQDRLLPEPNAAPPTPQNSPSQQQENTTPGKTTPSRSAGAIELTADSQDYDSQRQIITAEGNVVIRFGQAVINADRVEVNLKTRLAVAQGKVILTRGQQVLRGNRFEYYFAQDSGVIMNASGEFNNRTAVRDLAFPLANNVGNAILPFQPLSDSLTANQPLQQITNPGGLGIGIGSNRNIDGQPPLQQGGVINRLRFEADRVDFNGTNLQASNVRITNDPFSPPELELRADTAQFTRISPQQDEVVTSHPRLVFDQNFTVPVFRNRQTIDDRQRQPSLLDFGFDSTDKGGFYVGANLEPVNTQRFQLSVTPQFLIQKAFQEGKYFSPDVFGVTTNLNANLGPNTQLRGFGILNSLNLSDIQNQLRANIQLNQKIGTTLPHILSLQYTYRDRLFNGSLGFQTVQSSFGAVLTSPSIALGKTGVYLNYQASAQTIDAATDFNNLLKPNSTNNLINLGRYQASASLGRGFVLWQGKGLPPTPEEGLRYSPVPIVPYLKLNTGVTGVITDYSSGNFQNSLSGNIGLQGQIGHFSQPYLDYTGFNLTYSQVLPNGKSPFLFDRVADTRVISTGITQQVYGPISAGFQTSVNLDTTQQISTDYLVEYNRRTYNILLRYNPILQIGSINFRLNDFNWIGNPGAFGSEDVRPVVQGVIR